MCERLKSRTAKVLHFSRFTLHMIIYANLFPLKFFFCYVYSKEIANMKWRHLIDSLHIIMIHLTSCRFRLRRIKCGRIISHLAESYRIRLNDFMFCQVISSLVKPFHIILHRCGTHSMVSIRNNSFQI